ncbi:MAG TPA: hypothetical protein VH298_06625 [Jatrophihabitans sp.]|jgi:hypothetical protein|nr:hypothetical protein [Jatrophihabitans sp.]
MIRKDSLLRILLGTIGVAAIGYGAVRILTDAKDTKPLALAKWLIGSLLVHDLLIAPVVIGIGWLLARFVPPRARAFAQGGLVTGGLVSALGVLLIWRQGKSSARSLALLQQDYVANLLVLLAIIAAATVACYLISVSLANRRNTRPPADH